MPWLISEDLAVKHQLSGITVSDGTSPATGRKVGVRFISPEDDLVQFEPPMILVSMPEIRLAFERMQSGGASMLPGTEQMQVPYTPEGQEGWRPDPDAPYDPATSPFYADVEPYDIDYQITVIGRIQRQHMLPIMAELEQPSRLGRMATLTIPQDGTFRRITRLGGPARQFYSYKDGPLEKRLFTAQYMIRVASEVVGPVTDTRGGGPYGLASHISLDIAYANAAANTDLSCYYNEEDLSPGELTESIGILGVRADVAWNTQARN